MKVLQNVQYPCYNVVINSGSNCHGYGQLLSGDRLPFGPALSAPAGGEFQDKTVNIHS